MTGTIKRVCETELGIVSQCCMHEHVKEYKYKYLKNLALKINVKVCIVPMYCEVFMFISLFQGLVACFSLYVENGIR